MSNAINLAALPAPDLIEPLDFEAILVALLQDARARLPQFSAFVESDPVYKLLEVAAYRELLLRQRINDACRGVMLAYAQGRDLEHLASLFGVTRQIVEPGDPSANPTVAPTYETDERLRARTVLALEGFSTAGPVDAYRFHGLAASGQVKDISVVSPAPGDVHITVLSHITHGAPSIDLLHTVFAYLNDETRRPLTDHVVVNAAEIIEYQVTARLTFYTGPDISITLNHALTQVDAYTKQQHRLGQAVTLSGIYAALHQPGVQNVVLVSPTHDIIVGMHQAAFCVALDVTQGDLYDR